jgi:hypothetical protein
MLRTRVWRLGVLSLIDNPAMHSTAMSQLAERGFVEGRNLVNLRQASRRLLLIRHADAQDYR